MPSANDVTNKTQEFIAAQVAHLTEELVFGAALKSIEDYRERVGQIRGLLDASNLLNEALQELAKAERGR